MTPAAFRRALARLSWSQRTLAARLARPHNTIHRWSIGAQPIPDDVAEWLTDLVKRVAEVEPPR